MKICGNVRQGLLNLHTKYQHGTLKDMVPGKDSSLFAKFCAPLRAFFLVWRPWGGPHHIFQVQFFNIDKSL